MPRNLSRGIFMSMILYFNKVAFKHISKVDFGLIKKPLGKIPNGY